VRWRVRKKGEDIFILYDSADKLVLCLCCARGSPVGQKGSCANLMSTRQTRVKYRGHHLPRNDNRIPTSPDEGVYLRRLSRLAPRIRTLVLGSRLSTREIIGYYPARLKRKRLNALERTLAPRNRQTSPLPNIISKHRFCGKHAVRDNGCCSSNSQPREK
jgi:hypothetical protein